MIGFYRYMVQAGLMSTLVAKKYSEIDINYAFINYYGVNLHNIYLLIDIYYANKHQIS